MKAIYLFFLLLAGTGFMSVAQQPLSLDLPSARRHAVEFNKTAINANLSTQKAQLALREAIANGLPQVNSTLDYSNALGAKISIRFNENMPASEIDIKPQSNFNLNVTQLVFSGNYIVGVQVARLYKDLAEMNVLKTELEIETQVTEAYHLVLVSEELLKILNQNLANLRSLYIKTSALESAGIIEKNDLDQLSVQVNTLENAVNASSRQYELAKNMLRLHLGVDPGTELILEETLEGLVAASLAQSVLQDFDIQNQIDYRMLSQQELVNYKMINMQKAHALPTLSGYYRYTYKLLKPDFDMTPANMVGLQMNIPIFSSGVRNAQVKQARIDFETTQNNKDLLSDQLKIQEKQLRFNYNSNVETYNNQKNNVEVSRRVYNSLKLKYEQGILSGLDLINADNNYLKAETDYISSMMQVLQSGVQLQKLYGKIN